MSGSGERGHRQVLPGGRKGADGLWGGNKAGRFLQVGIYVEGGRKGGIWIPEGRNGSGWRRFANEFRLFLSSKGKGLDLEASKIPSSAGIRTWRWFAEVTWATLGPEVRFLPMPPSSSPLDVFPFLGRVAGMLRYVGRWIVSNWSYRCQSRRRLLASLRWWPLQS
jgi:hypothetical protein